MFFILDIFLILIKKFMTTAIYLNFKTETEQAFNFYQSVFGGEFVGGIFRMGDTPKQEGQPELSDADRKLIMHVALELPGGILLHGTDAPESMGFNLKVGDNFNIMIMCDSKEQADSYFAKLSEGGNVSMPMSDQFWGDYFGSFTDKFGINWMISFDKSSKI